MKRLIYITIATAVLTAGCTSPTVGSPVLTTEPESPPADPTESTGEPIDAECPDASQPIVLPSEGFMETTSAKFEGDTESGERWLNEDTANPVGMCNYGWEYENVGEDATLAYRLAEDLPTEQGFDCDWVDHDAVQRRICTRGQEHLTISAVGFVSVVVVLQVPTG